MEHCFGPLGEKIRDIQTLAPFYTKRCAHIKEKLRQCLIGSEHAAQTDYQESCEIFNEGVISVIEKIEKVSHEYYMVQQLIDYAHLQALFGEPLDLTLRSENKIRKDLRDGGKQ